MTHILPTRYETDNRGPVLELYEYGGCVENLLSSRVKSIGNIELLTVGRGFPREISALILSVRNLSIISINKYRLDKFVLHHVRGNKTNCYKATLNLHILD